MAPLRYAAKFDPYLSLDCGPALLWRNPRKGRDQILPSGNPAISKDLSSTLLLISRVFSSLPVYSQHLLVLLFGTFRVIHSNCEAAQTGMTAEALGVSVAPSFFHTCVAAGKTAKMEDVQRFKVRPLEALGWLKPRIPKLQLYTQNTHSGGRVEKCISSTCYVAMDAWMCHCVF